MIPSVEIKDLCDKELLEMRISDIPLSIKGTWLEACVEELYSELSSKGVRFHPECYLADEWLTPDKEPVIGIPFYLADPVLMRLEKKMMFEVEGGTKSWCMRLLRHEAGHALNYAYRFYRRKRWKEIFGPFTAEYGDTYRFRPYSKNFVRHLEKHYAQYHPDEDFAETVAVWLTPGMDWKRKYEGWKAIEKLEYVDELMRSVLDKDPAVRRGVKYWRHPLLKIKLKNYYKKKKDTWAEEFPDFHDAFLNSIFRSTSEGVRAAKFIKGYRGMLLANISKYTGERKYIINGILRMMEERTKVLGLYSHLNETEAIVGLTSYITTLIVKYKYTGRFRG